MPSLPLWERGTKRANKGQKSQKVAPKHFKYKKKK
jgi:hypothetical protein